LPNRPFTAWIYWSCIPLVTRDVDSGIAAWWRATGWCCCGVFSKRQDVSGKPPMNYFSFKGVRARTLDIGQG
jgi:hypothetical protein